MKRAIGWTMLILLLVSCTIANADYSSYSSYLDSSTTNNIYIKFIDALVKQMYDNVEFRLRGIIQWGMNADEVMNALQNEKVKGKNKCSEVTLWENDENATIKYITAKAALGEYTPILYCEVSELWGLYNACYYFCHKDFMTETEYFLWKKKNDESILETYETIEKSLIYIYGKTSRSIDKWDERKTLEDLYYIFKEEWNKGGTTIILSCYKSNGIYQIELQYQSPNYSDYQERLDQDLRVTSVDMFYGY